MREKDRGRNATNFLIIPFYPVLTCSSLFNQRRKGSSFDAVAWDTVHDTGECASSVLLQARLTWLFITPLCAAWSYNMLERDKLFSNTGF